MKQNNPTVDFMRGRLAEVQRELAKVQHLVVEEQFLKSAIASWENVPEQTNGTEKKRRGRKPSGNGTTKLSIVAAAARQLSNEKHRPVTTTEVAAYLFERKLLPVEPTNRISALLAVAVSRSDETGVVKVGPGLFKSEAV